jgi:hypothetical protein
MWITLFNVDAALIDGVVLVNDDDNETEPTQQQPSSEMLAAGVSP